MNWLILPRAGLLALSCAFAVAQAQTPPAKPVKPAAVGVKSLGKGTGAGMPLLDKEQLRACFKQRDELEVRLKAAEAEREPLNAEKDEITAMSEALRAERSAVEGARAEIDQLGVKFKAFSERVAAWNAAVKEFNESGATGPGAQRKREAINKEREAMEAERKLLEAEKERVTNSAQATVTAYNTKVEAHQQRATSWNERNRLWNESSAAIEAERGDWVSNCADRRYREDDEIAIKAGR